MNSQTKAKFHIEKIICPECDTHQEAKVSHTVPFWSYAHQCINCKYWITESEWQEEKKDVNDSTE